MAVGALEGKFWKICCTALERPEWITRQWDAGLRGDMAALFATRPRDDWAALFAAVDCCVTPVLSPEEALENEQIIARKMVLHDRSLAQFAPPLKLSGHDFAIRQPAPKAGEHNAHILCAAGYSEDEIAALVAAGVV